MEVHWLSLNFCFSTFQAILCVEQMLDQSLVVVERPLTDITSQLPAPIKQKKFAT